MKSLEEYKTEINKLAQNNIKGGLSSAAKLLKSDLENNKIDKEQYFQLSDYIRKIEEERKNQEQNRKNEETKKEILKFRESLTLKVIPIYKGKLGQIAPKRKEDKEVDR